MSRGSLAHSLMSAHAERVSELARLCTALERAAVASGTSGEAARSAHRALGARIVEWEVADLQAEQRDVISPTAAEREQMLRDIDRAIGHAERHAEGLPPDADEHAVVASLRELRATCPTTLPRAALVRFRRSAARSGRIEALKGPEFLLGSEAGVLAAALERARAPIAPVPVEFDPEDGFRGSFVYGLEACVIREPGAAGAVDLGLGASPAVSALLGVAHDDLDDLYARWVQSADPSHPMARYPEVPRDRFCQGGPTSPLRGDLDRTGPVGWGAAADVSTLAGELSAAAGGGSRFAPELAAAAGRVESAARRGHAVIGFIEYLPPESEGQRKWLIDPEADSGG